MVSNEGELPIKKEDLENEENSSNLHKCKVCDYVCRTSYNLWYHVRSVHERFKCPICDRNFASKQYVVQHIIKSHSEDSTQIFYTKYETDKKSYKCPNCENVFATEFELVEHLQKFCQNLIKKFKCYLCDQTCVSKKRLKDHFDINHQGHKPYQCSMCKMTFPKTCLLEQHIQEFHEKRRPFDCEVCQKKFFRKKHLLVHNTSTYHKKRVAWSEKENKENLAPKNLTKNSPKKSSSKPSLTEVFIKECNQEKFEESGNVFSEKNDDEQNSKKQNISKGDTYSDGAFLCIKLVNCSSHFFTKNGI